MLRTLQQAGDLISPFSLRIFLICLVAGILFAVVTPPFQAPDEAFHVYRAYGVSQGNWVPIERDSRPGDWIPSSLGTLRVRLDTLRIAGHPDEKMSLSVLLDELRTPLDPQFRSFADFSATSYATPFPYLPQAAGLAVGRLLGLSPVLMILLARLSNLIAASVLIAIAIGLAPFFNHLFAVVTLVPMAVFLRSSASPDALTFALALLLVASILRVGFGNGERARLWEVGIVVASVMALAASKPGYGVLALIALIVPPERLGSRGRWLLLSGAVLAIVLSGLFLTATNLETSLQPLRSDGVVAPGAQLDSIRTAPWRFLSIAGRDLVHHGARYSVEMIGRLGWLDTPIPVWLTLLVAVMMVGLAVTDGHHSRVLTASRKSVVAVSVALATLMIVGTFYVLWTRPGSVEIEGVQGRYFLPLAPAALLLLYNRRWALDWSEPPRSRWLFAALILSPAAALLTVIRRFYL